LPDVIVLNGEEDKVMGIPFKEWFRSKASFGLGDLVFQYFASWRWGLLSFPCGTSGVGANSVVAYEFGDLPEGLVCDNMAEQHGG
jgi:hypothetical protein